MSCARLVGLGLEGEDEVVLPVLDVVGEEVEGVAEALAGLERVLGGVALDALAAAPEDVHLRPELDAEVDGVHRLLQGVGAHPRVVGGEGAVLESGVAEEVGGGHGDHDPGVGQGLLEVLDDLVALGRRGVDRHEVVVVEVDAVGPHLGQQVDDLDRREHRAHRLAEGVAAGVADRPEAERELVLRLGGEGVAHGVLAPWITADLRPSPGPAGTILRPERGYAGGMKLPLATVVLAAALPSAPAHAEDVVQDLGALFPGFRSTLVLRDVDRGRTVRYDPARAATRTSPLLHLQDPELPHRARDGRHPGRVVRAALGRRPPPARGVEPRPRPALGHEALGRLVLPGAGATRGPRADAEVGLGLPLRQRGHLGRDRPLLARLLAPDLARRAGRLPGPPPCRAAARVGPVGRDREGNPRPGPARPGASSTGARPAPARTRARQTARLVGGLGREGSGLFLFAALIEGPGASGIVCRPMAEKALAALGVLPAR